jgi:hypothetical protein
VTKVPVTNERLCDQSHIAVFEQLGAGLNSFKNKQKSKKYSLFYYSKSGQNLCPENDHSKTGRPSFQMAAVQWGSKYQTFGYQKICLVF